MNVCDLWINRFVKITRFFFLIHSSLESVLCLIRYGTESAGKEKKKGWISLFG